MATPVTAPAVMAKHVTEVPLDPQDAAWSAATPTNIELVQQAMQKPIGGGAVRRVEVRALHGGGAFAVRLTWENPTDESLVAVKDFRDACAVMFPVASDPFPSALMGHAGAPVLIWQWKADWEDFPAAYAARMSRYPDYSDYHHPTNDTLNAQFGDKPGAQEKVDVLVAEGFGSATRIGDVGVEAKSARAGAYTRVVFRREIPATAPSLSEGVKSAINVAVWEGANGERGSRKSVSLVWTDLLLEASRDDRGFNTLPPVSGPMVALGALLLTAGLLFSIGMERTEAVAKLEREREARRKGGREP